MVSRRTVLAVVGASALVVAGTTLAVSSMSKPKNALHYPSLFIGQSEYTPIDKPFVDMLVQGGANVLGLQFGEYWILQGNTTAISRLDATISYARSRGMKIRIITSGMFAPVFSTPPTLSEVVQQEGQVVQYVVNRWNPEYYNVVEEPSAWEFRWGLPFGTFHFTNAEWLGIINSLSQLANTETWTALNPAVQGDLNLISGMGGISALNGIGLDIYGSAALATAQSYVPQIKATGKKGSVMETWLWPGTYPGPFPTDPSEVAQEAAWLTSLYNIATQANFGSAFLPWWTERFALIEQTEGTTSYVSDLQNALNNGSRTSIFNSWKNLR